MAYQSYNIPYYVEELYRSLQVLGRLAWPVELVVEELCSLLQALGRHVWLVEDLYRPT